MESSRAADDAGGHAVRSCHDRNGGGGNPHRSLRFSGKPIGLQKLLSTVQRALKVGQAKRASAINLADLGESQVINELRARLETLVNERRTALLTGEVGVGFIECARALHEPNTPWLVLESGQRLISSPLEILESARGGTLYCPEVAHLSRSEQRSLAFMLGKTGTYGVRIVCASSEPLGQLSGEPL
jgi:DNA-binding NtrC family response regulator